MSDMVERVALAISGGDDPANILEIHRHRARLAIGAMRGPSNAMIVAGDDRILTHLNNHEILAATPTPAQNCFNAMIDEALK